MSHSWLDLAIFFLARHHRKSEITRRPSRFTTSQFQISLLHHAIFSESVIFRRIAPRTFQMLPTSTKASVAFKNTISNLDVFNVAFDSHRLIFKCRNSTSRSFPSALRPSRHDHSRQSLSEHGKRCHHCSP
jgi:hypothetical protein